MRWLRWRVGLAVGKMLKRIGGRFLGAGWRMVDRSAMLYNPNWSTVRAGAVFPAGTVVKIVDGVAYPAVDDDK